MAVAPRARKGAADSDESSESESDESSDEVQPNTQPRATSKKRRPRACQESGIAPRQVPRQRHPQKDGFRLVGA